MAAALDLRTALFPQRVEQLLADRFGLAGPFTPAAIERALQAVADRLGVGPADVAPRLDREPALLRELAGRLTIGETYFFRHPEQLEFVAATLARRVAARGSAAIWSAGCSHGDELTSMALALHHRLGPAVRDRVTLVGSDLSADAVAAARAGVWGSWSFRGDLPDALQRRYFLPLPDGRAQLADDLQGWARFEHLSVQEHLARIAPAALDAILFRNVGVYLVPERLAAVFAQFATVLAEGGLLVQSATDPAPPAALFEPLEHAPASIYVAASDRSSRSSAVRDRSHGEPSVPSPAPPAPPGLDSTAAARLVDRGERLLHAGRPREAAAELRRALFLEPGHRLARYGYAVALVESGDRSQAAHQLDTLARQLALASSGPLEDGHTTPQQLERAVRVLRENLR